MREIELKFQIPAERRAAVWSALRRGPLSSTRLRAHYFDTSEGLLAGHAIALRLRHEGDRWIQTLKATEGNSAVRLEHNVEVASSADATPILDPSRHAGSPAYRLLNSALAAAGQGEKALREVYRTDIQRHNRLLKVRGALIELALDEGDVIAGEARHSLCEIEFELKSGAVSGLFTLAALWVERYGLWLDTVTKSERGHLLARGQSYGPAVRARPPAFTTKPDPGAFARSCVEACLAQVLPNASAIAAGSEQAQHVHQLRVGLRRLRTALGEMAEFDCGIDAGWEPRLALLFKALGTERDRHMIARLEETLRGAGSPPLPPLPPSVAPGSLSALLRVGDIQQVLLAALAFATNAAPASGIAFEGDPLEALCTRLDQLRHEVKRDARRFADAPVDVQHRTRRRLKRLRYLAEFVTPLFGDRPASTFLQAVRRAQDASGASNDEAVAMDHYREQAAGPGHAGAYFAMGWLAARQAASALAAAQALKAAVRAPRFWRSKRRRG